MYCPKCGKENPEDAKFCMHCGVDLREYKVEISPKIDVSPNIEVKPTISPIIQVPPSHRNLSFGETEGSVRTCDICGERKAVVTCKMCGRKVCNYHFEMGLWGRECTLYKIGEYENIISSYQMHPELFSSDDRAYHESSHELEKLKSKLPPDLR
jgi:adenine-specific DNA methylase